MLFNYGNTALNDAAFSVFEPTLARYSISYPFSSSTKNRPLYFSMKQVKGKFQGAHPNCELAENLYTASNERPVIPVAGQRSKILAAVCIAL